MLKVHYVRAMENELIMSIYIVAFCMWQKVLAELPVLFVILGVQDTFPEILISQETVQKTPKGYSSYAVFYQALFNTLFMHPKVAKMA